MQPKKKICFIVSEPDNAKWFLKTPILKLRENFEVHLIANFSEQKPKSYIDFTDFNHTLPIERKINLLNDLLCLKKAITLFKQNKFDSIHSVTPKAGLISMLAGFVAKIPIRIHTFTGQVWATKRGTFKLLLMTMDRIINFFATNVIVDGESQREFLIEKKIITEKSIVFGKGSICGVDTNRFKPSKNKRINLREKYNIKENEWVFMFLGRINAEKGVKDLINAFINIKESYNQKLFIVGPDEDQIISKNINSIKNNNIIYIPLTDKPEDIMQISDTFCLPSYREGFGLSVIEASALEKPIICSDAYGLRDTIKVNITGLKHKKGSVSSLQQKLIYVLENKEKIKKMGKNGREYVLKNFSFEEISFKWFNFYVQLHDNPYKEY